jgi:hypothetical protein
MNFDGGGDYFAGDVSEWDLGEHAGCLSKPRAARLRWTFEVRGRRDGK